MRFAVRVFGLCKRDPLGPIPENGLILARDPVQGGFGTEPVRKFCTYGRNPFSLHLVCQKHDYSLFLSMSLSLSRLHSLCLSLCIYAHAYRESKYRTVLTDTGARFTRVSKQETFLSQTREGVASTDFWFPPRLTKMDNRTTLLKNL